MLLEQNFGKAVKRNRIKRLIRESYRLNEREVKKVGYNIVFLVKKNCDISLISFREVEDDIVKILQRVGQDK